MGSGPGRPPADPACTARANGLAALTLLQTLHDQGLRHLVLCPGSRSAPLAVAAALLEPRGLRLHTAIDERSAAFFALGLGRALGLPAAVVTTSGTAVAQLLAAAVEADLGTIPLLLLSADRPQRLKDCGANQAVPQERFLLSSCRRLLEGPSAGLAAATPQQLEAMARDAFRAACGDGWRAAAGPVHLNLPFEEPLHADGADLEAMAAWLRPPAHGQALQGDPSAPGSGATASATEAPQRPGIAAAAACAAADATPDATQPVAQPRPEGGAESETAGDRLSIPAAAGQAGAMAAIPRLDPDRTGVIVAGPWRGTPQDWPAHVEALRRWQQRSGWPLLADALSGLRGLTELQVVSAYDPLLIDPSAVPAVGQVLRLGSLPASRRLQAWLEHCGARQLLVSQGDPRRLDPLGVVADADQWSGGLASWVEAVLGPAPQAPAAAAAPAVAAVPPPSRELALRWQQLEELAQEALERQLCADAEPGELAGAWGSGRNDGLDGDARRDQQASGGTMDKATDGHSGMTVASRAPQQAEVDSRPARLPESGNRDGADPGMAQSLGWNHAVAAGGPPEAHHLPAGAPLCEPWLARSLGRLLPPGLPVMLASSSPVRDWESFSAADAPWRPLHGFRGASGIDGTLSIACGLAEALGQLVLVSGDLALLHDANGWLWARRLRGRLTVLLIENGGGGIFEQLPIRTQPPERLDFERLFAMPQGVDQLALAAVHGVPGRRLWRAAELPGALAWALQQPFSLLELRTDRRADAALRPRLRQIACAAASGSAMRMAGPDRERR